MRMAAPACTADGAGREPWVVVAAMTARAQLTIPCAVWLISSSAADGLTSEALESRSGALSALEKKRHQTSWIGSHGTGNEYYAPDWKRPLRICMSSFKG